MSGVAAMHIDSAQPEQPYLVVGLGESGLACACHLHARGLPVEVVDTRAAPPGLAELRRRAPDVAFRSGPLESLLGAGSATRWRALVVSPGVPLDAAPVAAARSAGAAVIGELDLFAEAVESRVPNARVAAVTGTNGKSTVTSLVGAMLDAAAHAGGWPAAAGGNLGPAALELLDRRPRPEVYALEVSSFQLERAHAFRPRVAALLNLSADHLDHHGSMAGYVAAKARVFRGARIAVVNLDESRTLELARDAAPGAAVRGFTIAGTPAPAGVTRYSLADGVLCRDDEALVERAQFAPAGDHNAANALAALAIADALGVPLSASLAALVTFRGLAHRSEVVSTHSGVTWLNDSKGTNVGATLAALAGVGAERPVILLAGGDGKGQDFTPLAGPVARLARAVVAYGRDAKTIAGALDASSDVTVVATLDDAVRAAGARAYAGDAVLLSPACASFDQFENYIARGEAFRAAVSALGASSPARGGGE